MYDWLVATKLRHMHDRAVTAPVYPGRCDPAPYGMATPTRGPDGCCLANYHGATPTLLQRKEDTR